jgi:hypothetical protein
MVICSESIETVSLSGALRCRENQGRIENSSILNKYNARDEHIEMSLHDYFKTTKNKNIKSKTTKEIIPHYVGGSGQPTFPVTRKYARATLLVHYPWSKDNPLPHDDEYTTLFQKFLESDNCPPSVLIPYERVKQRYEKGLEHRPEPFSPDQEESSPTEHVTDQDTLDMLAISETMVDNTDLFEQLDELGLDYGKERNWKTRIYTVTTILYSI